MNIYMSYVNRSHGCTLAVFINRDAETRKGKGQFLLRGTDEILTLWKSLTGNLDGQLHSRWVKFLPVTFLFSIASVIT